MTPRELRQGLLDRLSEYLGPSGYRRREQSFWKEAGRVRQVVHVAFINHANDFDVTADVAIRHHVVEDALNAERPHLDPRTKRETATVGAELGNLAGVGQHRWSVVEAADIEQAARGIRDWLARVGQPFLERFSSAVETLRVLEEDGAEARLICPLPEKRARVQDVLRDLRDRNAL